MMNRFSLTIGIKISNTDPLYPPEDNELEADKSKKQKLLDISYDLIHKANAPPGVKIRKKH